jgi:hypothetical protein
MSVSQRVEGVERWKKRMVEDSGGWVGLKLKSTIYADFGMSKGDRSIAVKKALSIYTASTSSAGKFLQRGKFGSEYVGNTRLTMTGMF